MREDPYNASSTKLTDNAEEEVKGVFTTPDKKTFTVGDDNLYLPTSIGAYDADTPINHSKFTGYEITRVSVIPKTKLAIGYILTAIFIAIPLFFSSGVATIFVSISLIMLLGTIALTIRSLKQHSTAAVVVLKMNHYSTEFVIKGTKKEIKSIEELIEDTVTTSSNTDGQERSQETGPSDPVLDR